MTAIESTSISNRVEHAFRAASQSTGTSFNYLLTTAARESSLRPSVKSESSSALGLFQFIESTWLEMVKEAGPKYGLQRYSDQITKSSSGRYSVADSGMRKTILDLRSDPKVAAVMAGEFTQKNAASLAKKLGRAPSDGELYMAHFLGAGGARKLIGLAASDPHKSAASAFPTQAKANKAIFYDTDGKPLSISRVYSKLAATHGGATTALASETATRAHPPAKGKTPLTAVVARGDPSSRVLAAWRAAEPDRAFDALFRTDAGAASGALASSLWSAFATDTSSLFSASKSSRTSLATSLYTSTAKPPAADAAKAGGNPIDLTQFLKRTGHRGTPKELLPPA